MARTFEHYIYKSAAYSIFASRGAEACGNAQAAIRDKRREIERYIAVNGEFGTSFEPVSVPKDAPVIVRAMALAARATGVGPMAAVAGAIAEAACRVAFGPSEAGYSDAPEAIVENGGDCFLMLARPALVAVYAGRNGALPIAFSVDPADTPIAICSSSSRMGHSVSLGDCDLATVVAADGALADAAATALCNAIRAPGDVGPAVERVSAIPGIRGALAVRGSSVGLAGHLPTIVRRETDAIRAEPGGTVRLDPRR